MRTRPWVVTLLEGQKAFLEPIMLGLIWMQSTKLEVSAPCHIEFLCGKAAGQLRGEDAGRQVERAGVPHGWVSEAAHSHPPPRSIDTPARATLSMCIMLNTTCRVVLTAGTTSRVRSCSVRAKKKASVDLSGGTRPPLRSRPNPTRSPAPTSPTTRVPALPAGGATRLARGGAQPALPRAGSPPPVRTQGAPLPRPPPLRQQAAWTATQSCARRIRASLGHGTGHAACMERGSGGRTLLSAGQAAPHVPGPSSYPVRERGALSPPRVI